MNITDAHLHLWDLSRVTYDWLSAAAGTVLCHSHTPEILHPQLSDAGVSRAILVQSANSLEDTDYLFEMADAHPWIAGVVAWLPLTDPEKCKQSLENHLRRPRFKGVRHLMHIEADDAWLLQSPVLESLRLVADAGIPFDAISINDRQFDSILETAGRIPSLNMVLDHLGQPPVSGTAAHANWSARLRDAASMSQLHAKISGLGTMPRPSGLSLEERFTDIVNEVIEVFGVDRVLCGGDWPVSRLDQPYAETWHSIESILQRVIREDRQLEQLLDRNAEGFYRL